jgi:membrane protein implicated in regulation of membrane protease activity
MEIFGFSLENLEFWHWLAFGGILFVFEVLTMSFFFLWLGAAAIFVGIITFIAPDIAWEVQLGLWALMSVLDIFMWRVYRKKNPKKETDEPNLNRRGDQYVGRVFTLEEPIENGFGKVKVDDSIWKVEAKTDIESGKKIKVTAVEGTILQVEES